MISSMLEKPPCSSLYARIACALESPMPDNVLSVWISAVLRLTSPVPASIVPQPIQTFVSGSNYPGQFIRQIDRNAYTWEVELSNGLEIKFDNQFNVIDIDD